MSALIDQKSEQARLYDVYLAELRNMAPGGCTWRPEGLSVELAEMAESVVLADPQWPLDAPQSLGPMPGRLTSVYAAQMTKSRKIYLSGPMKGYPESNYPLFRRIAAELRDMGHEVYNPAEFKHDGPHDTFPLRKAFAEYSAYICNEADTIVLLAGWEKSLGVSAELALAKNCKIEIIEHRELFACLDC